MSWFRTEIDLRYFDELPESIQIEIFKGFLFKPFISCFKKQFEIQKNSNLHSVYKWEDTNFAQFMIALMKTLEPRRYQHGEVIHGELEEVLEIQFVV